MHRQPSPSSFSLLVFDIFGRESGKIMPPRGRNVWRPRPTYHRGTSDSVECIVIYRTRSARRYSMRVLSLLLSHPNNRSCRDTSFYFSNKKTRYYIRFLENRHRFRFTINIQRTRSSPRRSIFAFVPVPYRLFKCYGLIRPHDRIKTTYRDTEHALASSPSPFFVGNDPSSRDRVER